MAAGVIVTVPLVMVLIFQRRIVHALFKAEGLLDSPSTGGVVDGLRSNPQVSGQEEVHEVGRRWRALAEKYEPHRLLVGEVNLEPARAARYTRADEMQQAFRFAFVDTRLGSGGLGRSRKRTRGRMANARAHSLLGGWRITTSSGPGQYSAAGDRLSAGTRLTGCPLTARPGLPVPGQERR